MEHDHTIECVNCALIRSFIAADKARKAGELVELEDKVRPPRGMNSGGVTEGMSFDMTSVDDGFGRPPVGADLG